jgi:hypothetical protein
LHFLAKTDYFSAWFDIRRYVEHITSGPYLLIIFLGTELETRPAPKKSENLAGIKATLKTLAGDSFTHAVEACAGLEATLREADNFKKSVKLTFYNYITS